MKSNKPHRAMVGPVVRVILFARMVEPMIAFYRDVLGMPIKVDQRAEGWVVFDAGAIELALHGGAEQRDQRWSPKVVIACEDLIALRERLKSAAVPVGDLSEYGGDTYLDASDPEGHDLQFVAKGSAGRGR